jgi:Protein of unknown function (DUF2637)
MSNESPARAPQPNDGPGVLRLLALVAVAAGVLLLAAAAFVLSYAGIHAVALSADVSPRLARIYPLIFDAMLVVACAAILSLRGAGLPSRIYAWLSMLVLLASAAAADALHATGTRLPHRPAAAAAAVIPWVLVLIGFGLLLCMLRQARLRRAAATARQATLPEPPAPARQATLPEPPAPARQATLPEPPALATARREIDSPPRSHVPSDGNAAQPVEVFHAAAPDLALDLAFDAEPGQDDPVSDEASPAAYLETPQVPRARAEQPSGDGGRPGALSASAFSPAPIAAVASAAQADVAIPGLAASAGHGLGADPADGPDPGPAAEITPAHEAAADPWTEPEADLDAEAAPHAEAEAEAEPGPEAESRPEAEAEAEPGPEAESRPEAEAEAEPGAKPWPSAPLPFDRMRSSPIPPQASAP